MVVRAMTVGWERDVVGACIIIIIIIIPFSRKRKQNPKLARCHGRRSTMNRRVSGNLQNTQRQKKKLGSDFAI
jgi:hypothetical protein